MRSVWQPKTILFSLMSSLADGIWNEWSCILVILLTCVFYLRYKPAHRNLTDFVIYEIVQPDTLWKEGRSAFSINSVSVLLPGHVVFNHYFSRFFVDMKKDLQNPLQHWKHHMRPKINAYSNLFSSFTVCW